METNIKFNTEDPFGPIIREMIARDYPTQNHSDKSLLLDLIEGEVYGTKNLRYGPKPSVESQFAIRNLIRDAISLSQPIRFVAPWGSEKPDGSIPDVAELSALKMMICLNDRIKKLWRPGIQINIRVEDASAAYLFQERKEQANQQAMTYADNLSAIAVALGLTLPYGGPIKMVRESSFVSAYEFEKEADKFRPLMNEWLIMQEGYDWGDKMEGSTVRELTDAGWGNAAAGLHPDTREYYYRQYSKMYPQANMPLKRVILARYFASALARKRLGLHGADSDWDGKHLDLAFLSPIPGTENIFGRRVYYRTVPSCITSNHIAPWRAKGFVVVNGESREAKINLASFNDLPDSLNKFSMRLETEQASVDVQSDYVVR